MPTIGWDRLQSKFVAQWALFAVPLFLLITPALYYSLDTPIGLLERTPQLANKFNSASDFLDFLRTTFFYTIGRFRPFYSFWNGLEWKIFGEVAWLHHLVRWLIYFGAVAFFIAAFRRISRSPRTADASPQRPASVPQIVPVALLAYLWLLFPNPCNVRIECVEHYSVFFLGLCNWAAVLMLTAERGKSAPRHHALFCLGFLGLLFSKEINVAPALWLLACWWGLMIAKGLSAKKLLMGSTLTLTLIVAIYRVSESLALAERTGNYYAHSKPILDRFPENAADILQGLFQYETSAAITAVFIFLLLVLVVGTVAKIPRRGFDRELAFILLLLGEFISMFLVLSLQYGITPRYWGILVPCLAALLAFAAKFLLDAAKRRKALANCAALALLTFIAFFVSANYYSFLYQVTIQHSARNLDDLLIGEVAQLVNAGEHIQTHRSDWGSDEVNALISSWNHEKHWPNSPYGRKSIHRGAPKNPRRPYYILDFKGQPGLVSLETHIGLTARTEYSVLGLPHKVASLVQGETPHVRIDWGMVELGDYRWAIHAVPHNMGDHLEGLISEAGKPVRNSFFDVYFDGNKIMYAKRPCIKEDVENWFFLHLAPVRETDLPESRKPHGFDNLDFHFRDYGVRNKRVCVAVRTLPQYPIKWISTGQYIMEDGTRIWETDFFVKD